PQAPVSVRDVESPAYCPSPPPQHPGIPTLRRRRGWPLRHAPPTPPHPPPTVAGRVQTRPASSAEPPGNVVLGALVGRTGQQTIGGTKLHELTTQEESSHIRHARGLLHVVGDDHNRDLLR